MRGTSIMPQTKARTPEFFARLFLAGALVVGAMRLVDLDADPMLVDQSGAFLSDEGWYLRASLYLANWGELRSNGDFTLFPDTPLFVAFHADVFAIFGPSLKVARIACSLLASISTLTFLFSARRNLDLLRWTVLVWAIFAAPIWFAYSRLALTDTFATSFGLLAIAAWSKSQRQGFRALSFLLALCALFSKSSYLYVPAGVLVVWGLQGFKDATFFSRGEATRYIALRMLGGIAILSACLLPRYIYSIYYPDDIALLTSINFHARLVDGVLAYIQNTASSFATAIFATDARTPFVLMVAGGGYALLKSRVPTCSHLFRNGCLQSHETQSVAHEKVRHPIFASASRCSPGTISSLLCEKQIHLPAIVFVLCILQHAILDYHPNRYFILAGICISYAILKVGFFIEKCSRFYRVAVIILALSGVASCAGLWTSTDRYSVLRAQSNMRRRILAEAASGTTVLGSGFAASVCLNRQSMRPMDLLSPLGAETLCERVKLIRPQFAIVDNESELAVLSLLDSCPGVTRIDVLAQHTVLDELRGRGPQRLLRLKYAQPHVGVQCGRDTSNQSPSFDFKSSTVAGQSEHAPARKIKLLPL